MRASTAVHLLWIILVSMSCVPSVTAVEQRPPSQVTVTDCKSRTAEVTWRSESNPDVDAKYLVQFELADQPERWYNASDAPVRGTVSTVVLQPWGMYRFRVVAATSGLASRASTTSCTTPPDRPSVVPENIRSLTHRKGRLIVTWDPVPRLYHNGPGFGYRLRLRRVGDTRWQSYTLDGDTNSHELYETLLYEVYTLYEFKVAARNALGSGPTSQTVQGYSGEAEPLDAPMEFRLHPTLPIEAHTAHFMWRAVDTSVERIQGDFKGYRIRYRAGGSGEKSWHEVDVQLSESELNNSSLVTGAVHGLPAFSNVSAHVVSRNTHYTGPPSRVISFQTPEAAPGAVSNFTGTVLGPSSVNLTWSTPEEPNGILLGYNISNGLNLWYGVNDSTTLGTVISKLTSNTTYRFSIVARTAAGSGDRAFVELTTEEGGPTTAATTLTETISTTSITSSAPPQTTEVFSPGQVKNLQGIALSPGEIIINWEAPATQDPIIYYKVEYNDTTRYIYNLVSPNKTRFIIQNNIAPGTTYDIAVTAITALAAGRRSDVISVQTPDLNPVENVEALALGPDQIIVNWGPPVRAYNVIQFELHYHEDYTGESGVEIVPPYITRFTLTDLIPGTTYDIYVTATTNTTKVKRSNLFKVKTPDFTAKAPRRINATALSSEKILVSWQSAKQTMSRLVKGYTIAFANNATLDGRTLVDVDGANVTEYVLPTSWGSRLEPGATYWVEVSAYTLRGDGRASRRVFVTLDELLATNPVQTTETTTISNTSQFTNITHTASEYVCSDAGTAGQSCMDLQRFFGSKKQMCKRFFHECCALCSHKKVCKREKHVVADGKVYSCSDLVTRFGKLTACTLFTRECCLTCKN